MLRNLIILFILVFTSSVSFASWTQWLETDCNQIKKNADINHSYYKAEKCWKSTSSSAQAWFFDFDDGEVYLWLDVQRIIDGRTIWGNDYAYQNTKIDNIKRIIPNGMCAEIDLKKIKPNKIFKWIKMNGVTNKEMYKTFNCGLGFCIIINHKNINQIKKYFDKKFEPYLIGKIINGGTKVKLKNNISW